MIILSTWIKWNISLKLISPFKSFLNVDSRKWRPHTWRALCFCWTVPPWTNQPVVLPELAAPFSALIHTLSTIWHILPSLPLPLVKGLSRALCTFQNRPSSPTACAFSLEAVSWGSEEYRLWRQKACVQITASFHVYKILMILTTPAVFEIK